MRTRTRVTMAVFAAMMLCGSMTAVAQDRNAQTIELIRKELMRLPYYGVFDFLAFSYDRGTVTLTGYAYQPNLKTDAERAVKRVPRVDSVKNTIEVLPVSRTDDELRWKTYYAIYADPFLSKYAPGGGVLWGHRHPFATDFYGMPSGPFVGYEFAGDYPIRLIVNRGRIRLLGIVDDEGDRRLAEFKAREVPGSFGVENQLIVEGKESPSSTSGVR